MVLMALVTTSMAGLLLPFVYPRSLVEQDRKRRAGVVLASLTREESTP
jgi:hypothetical protein